MTAWTAQDTAPQTRRSTSERGPALTLLIAVSAASLTGCAPGTWGCERGKPDPESTLAALLTAVQEEDASAAKTLLTPGYRFSQPLFDELHDVLETDSIEDLTLTNFDQASTAYLYRVTRESGEFVASFEIHQLDTGCFAAGWGN